jgi:hypothetical protein
MYTLLYVDRPAWATELDGWRAIGRAFMAAACSIRDDVEATGAKSSEAECSSVGGEAT